MFPVTLLYALFASVFIVGKIGLEAASPLFLVGSRMLLGGGVLLAYLYFFQKRDWKFELKDWKRLFVLAACNIYLTNACEFWGLKYLTSAKTCFLYSLSPFISALLAYFILKEKLTSKKWLGLFVGFAGFIPILLSQTTEEELTGHFFIFSWAELSVMMAAICSVYGWILLSQLVKDNGYHPLMANGLAMSLGGAMALVHSSLIEDWSPVPVFDPIPFLLCSGFLIVVSNCVCYNLYGYLLKHYSATFMSFAGFMTPLFAAAFGWLFLGEWVSWPFYLSGAIVFSGLLLFYQEELSSVKIQTDLSIENNSEVILNS